MMIDPALRFEIPGRPQAWKRAGRGGGKSFTPAPVKQWQQRIQQRARLLWGHRPPIVERFLGLRIYVSMPLTKKGAETRPLRFGDADNICKGIADALQGIVIGDDSWFWPIEVHRVKGSRDGNTWVEIYPSHSLEDLPEPPQ